MSPSIITAMATEASSAIAPAAPVIGSGLAMLKFSLAVTGGVAAAGTILYLLLKRKQNPAVEKQTSTHPEVSRSDHLKTDDQSVNEFTKGLVGAMQGDINTYFARLEKEEKWDDLREFLDEESDLVSRAREILEKHGKL